MRIAAALVCLATLAVLAAGPSGAQADSPEPQVRELAAVEQTIARLKATLVKRTAQRDKARRQRTRYRRGLFKLRRVVRRRVEQGDVTSGLRCIQGFEGSWRDPASPYWGGLQMDRTFQRTYGRPLVDHLGTADEWPPLAQLAVGIVAYYSGRGFGPWPNTARMCGLR